MELHRGIQGKEEEPVTRYLNDIRQLLEDENPNSNLWDMAVLDEKQFTAVAKSVIPEGLFTDQQIKDSYLEMHLISELGGSHALSHEMIPAQAKQGQNAGKHLLKFIPPSEEERMIADNRSRQAVGAAMFGNWALLPANDSKKQIKDTGEALELFLASTRKKGEEGQGLAQLGNSGIRANLKADTPELRTAYIQNFNDLGRGFDRFSRDAIFNQVTEFGHYVPVERGGLDASGNGRMQAMPPNKATREKVGVQGMLRAYGPSYHNNVKALRKAGQIFAA